MASSIAKSVVLLAGIAAGNNNNQYQCQTNGKHTLTTGTFDQLQVSNGCTLDLSSGVSLSGQIQIQGSSSLTIQDSKIAKGTHFGLQNAGQLTITAPITASDIQVSCQNQAKATLNGKNICGSGPAPPSGHQYQCQTNGKHTLTTGTFDQLQVDNGCALDLSSGVSLSGQIQIQGSSSLTIQDSKIAKGTQF
eukprot:Pgem_evm1s20263